MASVDVLPEEREFIAERIARFDVEAPDELGWQGEYVRTHRALPLYVGWTETLGIRADGRLVRWSTEGELPGAREFKDATWMNTALVQGAQRYPQLRRLIPLRPASARTCSGCQGTGKISGLPPNLENVICECGGIGWIPGDGAG